MAARALAWLPWLWLRRPPVQAGPRVAASATARWLLNDVGRAGGHGASLDPQPHARPLMASGDGALAVSVSGVSKQYRSPTARWRRQREHWALRDVDLHLERGETLGILGHNGAGKTTLLRLLAGVTQPDRAAGCGCADGSRRYQRRRRVPPRDVGPGERLRQRHAARASPGERSTSGSTTIVEFAELDDVHRHAGEVLLVGHVHAAGVQRRGARRPRGAARRRGARRRRPRLPAQVLRAHARAPGRPGTTIVLVQPLDARHPPVVLGACL